MEEQRLFPDKHTRLSHKVKYTRKKINDGTLEDWKRVMFELTKLQQQIEFDVKFNPIVLPIQELPMYIQSLRHELSDLDKLTKKLKSHEYQIKQCNIDFKPIYAGIEASSTQCQTKLALMEMFKWG